jgi:hypothetical protein
MWYVAVLFFKIIYLTQVLFELRDSCIKKLEFSCVIKYWTACEWCRNAGTLLPQLLAPCIWVRMQSEWHFVDECCTVGKKTCCMLLTLQIVFQYSLCPWILWILISSTTSTGWPSVRNKTKALMYVLQFEAGCDVVSIATGLLALTFWGSNACRGQVISVFCKMSSLLLNGCHGLFPCGWSAWDMTLTVYLHLLLRLGISGAIPPLFLIAFTGLTLSYTGWYL